MTSAQQDGDPDRRARAVALVVPTLIGAAAALIRLTALGDPAQIVFDETYYVPDARAHLAYGAEEGFAVHPPVGKWLIAAGIAVVGDSPTGWRSASAVAGTVLVLLVYAAGLRLFHRVGPAALGALLVALDGLLIVQSRIAMLDGFLALFVVAGAWLLVIHRDRTTVPGQHSPRGRYALLGLAGAMFGLAVATKWSGLLALGAGGLVALAVEIAGRRRGSSRPLRTLPEVAAVLLVTFVVVPAVVYAASYVPWLAGYAHTHEGASDCVVDEEVLEPCPVGLSERVAGLARHHVAMWRFHRDLEADHPYLSTAASWPLLIRPVVYHWESCPEEGEPGPCVVDPGNASEIIALGNPVLWWGALAALFPLLAGALRRDARAGLILAFWALLYVPWLVPDRPLFIFYMTPVVPFMALAVAYATRDRRAEFGRGPAPVVAAVVAVLATLAFIYFQPVWTGIELDEQLVRQRWWFESWV